MEVIKYPSREEWASLALRPALDVTTLFDTVRTVLDEVREAEVTPPLSAYEEKFDKSSSFATFKRLQVSEEEMQRKRRSSYAEELEAGDPYEQRTNIEIVPRLTAFYEGKKVETYTRVSPAGRKR